MTKHSFLDGNGWTLRSFLPSIKGKIFLLFAVTLLSVGLLTVINVWSLRTVEDHLLLGERYDDLLNDILEVRRLEKNYLLYADATSLEEGQSYLRQIRKLAFGLSEDITRVAGPELSAALGEALDSYTRTFLALAPEARLAPERVRAQGKTLMDLAVDITKTKRHRIHESLNQASILPFALLGVVLLSMVLVIQLISMGMLKPLAILRSTTERVARGDFSPIPPEPRQLLEISGLIEAFNRMARELDANQEDLVQARKMASLGTFTAGIAHELNNPINNIALTGDALNEEYGELLDEEGREMIGDVLEQADRASDIVRNLLDFSRTESPAFSDLEPKIVARSTVALIKNQVMLSGIHLELDVAEELPPLRGNLRSLQQVFMNLLLNAVQATPANGCIWFTAQADGKEFIRFDVRDNGEGMNAETRQHIFDPFYTTKEVGRGTGLGMAVTYAIVQRHGGRIDIESEAGQGSVFHVFLPQAKEGDA